MWDEWMTENGGEKAKKVIQVPPFILVDYLVKGNIRNLEFGEQTDSRLETVTTKR